MAEVEKQKNMMALVDGGRRGEGIGLGVLAAALQTARDVGQARGI